MAGIGIEFRRIYHKRSVFSNLQGFGQSLMNTLTPMLSIIVLLSCFYLTPEYKRVLSADRELFSATVVYIFMASMILHSILSAPVSRYIGDILFAEQPEKLMPAYSMGLLIELGVSSVFSSIFYALVCLDGGVETVYTILSYTSFMAMMLVLHNMTFMSATKDLRRLALYYIAGMLLCYLCARLLALLMPLPYAILAGLTIGFTFIAALEYAWVRSSFPVSDKSYRAVLSYYRSKRQLMIADGFYAIGLFSHNFVYWAGPLNLTVAKYYISAPTYDQACFVALLTNVLASICFSMSVESRFTERYRTMSYAVLKGRLSDVENAVNRMLRMKNHIVSTVLSQHFIIATGAFFIIMVVLPGLGLYGLTTEMYPCVAAGYFAVYEMHSQIMFLNYFDDQLSMLKACAIFLFGNIAATILTVLYLPMEWQGLGLFISALAATGYTCARLNTIQKHFYAHIFCKGSLVKKRRETPPDNCVYIKSAAKSAGEQTGAASSL